MTSPTLRYALGYAARGWPVFPCQPGQKIPATQHGYRDATTDPDQITAWFSRHPGRNLAIATGAPGPDVLDVDQHGPAGNGFAAFARLRAAGLSRVAGVAATVGLGAELVGQGGQDAGLVFGLGREQAGATGGLEIERQP